MRQSEKAKTMWEQQVSLSLDYRETAAALSQLAPADSSSGEGENTEPVKGIGQRTFR